MDLSSLAACDAPKFCCGSGVQGDQKCQGLCIMEHLLHDGYEHCDNGLDEKAAGYMTKFGSIYAYCDV